jgi:hypothetical protein
MNLVTRSDETRPRRKQCNYGGGKHFALAAVGLASVTLVALSGMWMSPGRHSAARQLFLPQQHHEQQPLYANNSQTHHHHQHPHRAFNDYRIADIPPLSTTSTISKLKRANKNDSDDDNRPIFFLHVGIPKTATTFLQCSICKDYYSKQQNRNGTNNIDAQQQLGRHERIFLQDNLVYIGTCPCDLPSHNFVLHNHDAIFDHNITWNEQHELGPVPFLVSKSNNDPTLLILNQTGMVPQLAESFHTRILQQVHDGRNNNAIMIFEGCHKFDQAHVAALAAFLNPLFRVHVIVAYRRLFEWLPSKYNSVHKPIGHGPIVDNAWPGMIVEVMQYGRIINQTISKTRPFALEGDVDSSSFGQLVRDIETWQQHPAQIVRDNYARYFTNVETIPLHDLPEPPRVVTTTAPANATDVESSSFSTTINPYLHHLFCSVLASSARHVCQAIRRGRIRGSESSTNPSVSLDYFRLAEAAHDQGWIPAHMPRSKVARLVQEKMQQADKVVAAQQQQQQQQHPLQCLPNATLSRLLNLSLATEAKMFGSQQAEMWRPGHERAFAEYRSKNKYCWLDTAALLRSRDNTNAKNHDDNKNDWIDFFKRLGD